MMADEPLDDDLISQDDIDALLESSSFGGDDQSENVSEDIDQDDDMGELSQDDIDSLLNSNSLASEDDTDDEKAQEADDLELISQDDIDQLISVGSQAVPDSGDEPEDDDFELISQDDIDNLLSSDPPAAEETVTDQGKGADADAADDEMELISQDDIDRLMSGPDDEEDDTEPSAPVKDEGEVVDLSVDEPVELSIGEDMDLSSLIEEEETTEPQPAQDPAVDSVPDAPGDVPGDDIIDDSEAFEVQNCLITQDAMDALMTQVDEEVDEPQDTGDVELDLDADQLSEALDLDPDPVPDPVSEESTSAEEPEDGEEISQDDIDALLTESDDDVEVSQEDIDALLTDSEDTALESEDDILISQDDIDSLLMASDQEDEDILGSLTDEDDDADEPGDIEDIADHLLDDELEDDDEDEVVLEGLEEEEPPKAARKKKAKKQKKASKEKGDDSSRAWYKSRLVIACAFVGLTLAIALPTAYFFFFSPSGQDAGNQTAQAGYAREVVVDTIDINVDDTVELSEVQQTPASVSGSLELKDFLILADDSEALAYVAADISIDYSDKRAYDEISANMPFYRGLIYDSIHDSLSSDKKDDITESDILRVVETALKKVLPGHYISTIRFDSFKAG